MFHPKHKVQISHDSTLKKEFTRNFKPMEEKTHLIKESLNNNIITMTSVKDVDKSQFYLFIINTY